MFIMVLKSVGYGSQRGGTYELGVFGQNSSCFLRSGLLPLVFAFFDFILGQVEGAVHGSDADVLEVDELDAARVGDARQVGGVGLLVDPTARPQELTAHPALELEQEVVVGVPS